MSDSNVEYLDVVTSLDIPVDRILSRANEANLDSVIVVGWNVDGEMYFASSVADGAECLWLMEMAKKRLLEIGDSA